MSDLLIHSWPDPRDDGSLVAVTPASAGWSHVGFEVLRLAPGLVATRETGDRELCIVLLGGHCHVGSRHGDWRALGGRPNPFAGPPDAAYLPPATQVRLTGAEDGTEVALCWAPALEGAQPRLLPANDIAVEPRGDGAHRRTVHPILMGDRAAASLLVCEVQTPAGHWSSFPPHKHDSDDPPAETLLEETYYHRLSPACGFGLQRVYTPDRELDETMSVGDGDVVLVPRGYHTVSAPPGYDMYYLNVMAGPTRAWSVAADPDHEWIASP